MSSTEGEGLARSVHQRLLSIARNQAVDFNSLLVQYVMERALYRLSRSPHASDFVLKGALLFRVWDGDLRRPTMDIDLLGRGDPAVERMGSVFRDVLSSTDTADGVVFDVEQIDAAEIRGAQEYGGARVRCVARIGTARIRTQIDIGFGDAVTPGPIVAVVPSLLDFPSATLATYPPETVIAEKLEAIVRLGLANSRMKDFYDLHVLSHRMADSSESIARAIQATFERRGTRLPQEAPVGLTPAFTADVEKSKQWLAFKSRMGTGGAAPSLEEVGRALAAFMGPLLDRARQL